MGLYQRGDKWWMSFMVNGIQERRSTETTDKKTAQKIYHKVMSELAEGKYFKKPVGTKKTAKEMIEKYLEDHSKLNKAASSQKNDFVYAQHFIKFLGGMLVSDIRASDVAAYKKARRKQGIMGSTINNELRFLSFIFKLAINDWEWLESNPVERVQREAEEPRNERWLTVEEEQIILPLCRPWAQEIILLALYTGLRKNEILKLVWSQVNLSRKTLTLVGRQQKNKASDTIPLNATALGVLKARHAKRALHIPNVFFNNNGEPYTEALLYLEFDQARKKVSMGDVRFHDLRHSFATRLVQNGVDIYKVQKLMRHKNPKMTQRYAHHSAESLRDGAEVLDRLVITNLSQKDSDDANQQKKP